MAIPFLNLVKKAKEKFDARKRPPTIAPLPSVEDKPQADKLAKRVTPYAVRTMTPEPSGPALAAASTIAGRRISVSRATMGAQADLGPSVAVSVEPRGERTVSLALSDVIAAMPPGYLKTNETFDTSRRVTVKAVDVEKGLASGRPRIPLTLIYQQIPEIFEHTVVPTDSATVVLPVQKVVDELSQLRVREDQTTETITKQVETPFLKLMMEESAKFGTSVAPFETTELSLPVEATPPSGLATETARIEPMQPRPVAVPPAAPAALKPAVPPPVSPAVAPVQPAPTVPLTPPATIPAPRIAVEPSRESSTPPRVPLVSETSQPEKSTTLPIGTGGPAFPRVPASSGSPVPPAAAKAIDPAAPAAQPSIKPPAVPPAVTPAAMAPSSVLPPPAGPTRIPFQLPEDAPPQAAAEQSKAHPLVPARVHLSAPGPVATMPAPLAPASPTPMGQTGVTLPLRPILQSLPPMQLAGDIESVPADAKISFPMRAIAPQLATGKVAIPPKDFHAALPEQYRGLFLPDAVEAPVQLSLPDVLANLPGDSLRMRDDQEVFTQDEIFETPFLAKAKEDAERFTRTSRATSPALSQPIAELPKQPRAKPELRAEVPKETTPRAEPAAVEAARVQTPPSVEHANISTVPSKPAPAPDTKPADEAPKFDAKAAVAQACALAGVSSCSVIFADGLTIAGNIPGEMHMEGLSAVAPTMLKKLEKHMRETQLGPLTCMTVHGEKSPVTFFGAGNLCLTAVHNPTELSAESRRELSRITQELSRTYPQLETAHVNH